MEIRELLEISEKKGYIKIMNIDYGYLIYTDNEKLQAMIINKLSDDDDLVMFQWTKYNVYIFSCKKFNELCENIIENKTRILLPNKIYEESFPKQRCLAEKKFNSKNYNFRINNGWIINVKKEFENQKRQQEINEFVESIN